MSCLRRVTPLIDRHVLAEIGDIGRADALRRGLELAVAQLEADPDAVDFAVRARIDRRPVPLKIPADLLARAQALVDAGRAASVAELVRAGAALAAKGGG